MLRVGVVTVALRALASSAAAAGRMASPERARRSSGTAQPERGSRSGRDRSHGLRRCSGVSLVAVRRIQRFGVRNVNGVTTVFGVVGKEVDARCRAAWLRVALPICPNGATGWVRAADVHGPHLGEVGVQQVDLRRAAHAFYEARTRARPGATRAPRRSRVHNAVRRSRHGSRLSSSAPRPRAPPPQDRPRPAAGLARPLRRWGPRPLSSGRDGPSSART
jgi:hypothetical protein